MQLPLPEQSFKQDLTEQSGKDEYSGQQSEVPISSNLANQIARYFSHNLNDHLDWGDVKALWPACAVAGDRIALSVFRAVAGASLLATILAVERFRALAKTSNTLASAHAILGA